MYSAGQGGVTWLQALLFIMSKAFSPCLYAYIVWSFAASNDSVHDTLHTTDS